MVSQAATTPINQQAPACDLIVLLLAKLSQALRSSVYRHGIGANLTPTQMRTLLFLSDSEPEKRTISALAKSYGVALPTAADIIAVLVRRKLVTREPHPDDRRSTLLTLTGEGERIRREIVGWEATIRHAIEALPYDRRDALMHALKEIIASLRPTRNNKGERACYACDHFRLKEHPGDQTVHHCELLNETLSASLATSEWPQCLTP